MSGVLNNAQRLARDFADFAGLRAVGFLGLTMAAALSEGVGLLLLIPLLGLLGVSQDSSSALGEWWQPLMSILGTTPSVEIILLIFVILVAVRQWVLFAAGRTAALLRVEFVAALRKTYFSVIGQTEWRQLNGERRDRLSQVLLTDSWRIGEAALNMTRILSSVLLLIVNVVIAMLIAPGLTLGVLVVVLLLTVGLSNRWSDVQQQGQRVSRHQTAILSVIENTLSNLRAAKMAGAVDRMQADFSASVDNLTADLSAYATASETTRMSLQLGGAVAVAIVVYVAHRWVSVSGAELLMLIFIAARLIPRVGVLNQYLHALLHDLPARDHAEAVMIECRAHKDAAVPQRVLDRPQRTIELQGIGVTHALDDVSLHLDVGETLGLQGPSGAGKSTLGEVLAGLLPPDRGALLLDGALLADDDRAAWRRHVGYVPQSTTLLRGTLRHNLSWVLDESVDDDVLWAALEVAAVADVVRRLDEGLDTPAERFDGTLSGGERQRIAIARELLREPTLLILDESTNALDEPTERRVLGNLRQQYQSLTVLIIAHRESAFATADRCIALTADGRLVS